MAAVAATGLTCCGGGGGEDNFAYKTISITSPTSNVGEMFIRVFDPIPEAPGRYEARYGFGTDSGSHKGSFMVESQSETEATVIYYISNYEQMINDQNAQGFYGSLIEGAERDNNGDMPNVDFPFMKLTLTYAANSKTSGSCTFLCTMPVDDDLTEEEKEKIDPDNDGYFEKTVSGGASFLITEN